MNHKEKLLEVYNNSFDVSDITSISKQVADYLSKVVSRIESNKAVYTVLITLMVHKMLHPEQDIRYHQKKMPGGFSGRIVDTQYITPALREIGLPAMKETGWLTRSLEQSHPYDFKYSGNIRGDGLRAAFLGIIDVFQNNPDLTESFLRIILHGAISLSKSRQVNIRRLEPERIHILRVVDLLEQHFTRTYNTHGGSKLPVLAFYALYECLVEELNLYENCILVPLKSHTASDERSKSAGDIEVKKDNTTYEAVEIKFDRSIDILIVKNACDRIRASNPNKYYVLSTSGINSEDEEDINDLISKISGECGCQLIVNGLYETLRYYLRLISSPENFFNRYIELVEQDDELKTEHKEALANLAREVDYI